MSRLIKRGSLKASCIASIILATSSLAFAQQSQDFNPTTSEPVMQSREDTKFSLIDMPGEVIYETPEGWSSIFEIDDSFDEIIKLIDKLHGNESYMFWKQEGDSVVLAVAPYEKFKSIQQVTPLEQDMSVVSKAGERVFWNEQYFRLKTNGDNIEILSTLPSEYHFDNLIPWRDVQSYYVKYNEQVEKRIVYNTKLKTFTDGEISFLDLRKVSKSDNRTTERVDRITINANYQDDVLTYVFTLDGLRMSNPETGESNILRSDKVQSYIVFNGVKEEAFGNFMDVVIFGETQDNLTSAELTPPVSSIQISLDIEDGRGKMIPYEDDDSGAKTEFRINNVALRLSINDFDTEESSLSGEYLLFRNPVSNFAEFLPEISFFPDLVRGKIESEAGSFINGVSIYERIINSYMSGSDQSIMQIIIDNLYDNEAVVKLPDIELRHSMWNVIGNGTTSFMNINGVRGYMSKLELGANGFDALTMLPQELIQSIPELRDLVEITNAGQLNTDLKLKFNATHGFDIRTTDRVPFTVNGVDLSRKLEAFIYPDLIREGDTSEN